MLSYVLHECCGERCGLVVEPLTPSLQSERVRGFDTYLRHVVFLSIDTFTPHKLLVIPRKQWLLPHMIMNEKLFTGTLSLDTPTM